MLSVVDKFQMLIGSAQPKKLLCFLRGEEMKINEKIYELRKMHHLSQEELADKLNVSRQTVSKWELGESSPDFDKIVPLCEVFNISTEELLRDRKIEEKESITTTKKPDVVKAILICVGILFYFLAVISTIVLEEYVHLDDGLVAASFLTLIAFGTIIIVFVSLTRKNNDKKEEKGEKEENPLLKNIISIFSLITLGIYLLISFKTLAWHITWIIWIVYAIGVKIIHLIFDLIEVKNEK